MRVLPLPLLLAAAAFAGAGAARADEGDARAGAQLYESVCLVCHGPGGASIIPTQPILAGQYAEYTAAQLALYKSGARQNAVMSAQAANLSEKDIADLAAYLAGQTPVIAGAADADNAAAGAPLYRHGDLARGLPACVACHGPAGAGIAPDFPRLSGQYAEYTAASLRAYAAGERPSDIMQAIAQKLSEEEIRLLAGYISGLAH